MVGMDDIHHVRRLRELNVLELGVKVGRRYLDRAAARYNRAAILMDSEMLIAKLQNIGLLGVELERYQPDVVGAIFDLSYKYCAWSAACATMRMNNKILKRFASVKIFGDICAPIEAGAQLTGREVAKARGCLGHQSLALINVSAEKFCEMLVSEVLIWLSSVASTKRASLSFSW